MSRFHPLTVTKIDRQTRDSVVLTLEAPSESRDLFRFTQGQYLTLRSVIDGEEARRAYSICAGIHDPCLRVGIKRVTDGLFSAWANEHIGPGHIIDAMPPAGDFHVPLDPANQGNHVGFATGSGITPLLSIIKSTLIVEPRSRFTLFYGNRASSTIMFREELEDLKSKFMQRFSLIHILSREHQDIELFNGRIDRAKCDQLLDCWIEPKSIHAAFICGPSPMMRDVLESLQAHGIERQRIKFELFTAVERSPRDRRPQRVGSASPSARCDATITIDGRSHRFSFPKNNVAVLDAAITEGLELPYACKAGVCSTCRAMLIEGQVDMDANFSLEDYEVARGYILTCQSFPATDKIVVDFDR